MAAPVWVLSVDLQAKTATFATGMAEAARSARSAFSDVKSGASDMGDHVSTNMFAARHSLMVLGDEFGTHLPRALTAFVAHLDGVGAALEAAFPFLAIVLGATLLLEELNKLQAAGVKLTEDQVRFGTAVQNAFNSLEQKILQAQIRSDQLRNDHLGALRHELELIDKQSMAELVQTFGTIAKAADVVFADLKSHWYTFGSGAEGAKHSLEAFTAQYESFLAKGDDKGASALLHSQLERETRILALQKQAASTGGYSSAAAGGHLGQQEQLKLEAAIGALKQMNSKWDADAIKAQQALVDVLNNQATAEGRIAELKKLDSGNATQQTNNEASARRAEAGRQAATSALAISEQIIAADRATAQARMEIERASVQERLNSELDFAQRDYDAKASANQREIAALDKSGKDYTNQLKGLQEKALELTQAHATAVAELTAKAAIESAKRDLDVYESGMREQIDATQQGSAARLAIIDQSIKAAEAKALQDTEYYRALGMQRVETARQIAEEEAKVKADAGREAADNTEKMAELALAAEKEQQLLSDSQRRVTDAQRLAEDLKTANDEFRIKEKNLQDEMAALDTGAKDYQNKLKTLQDKETQLVQQHENDVTSLKDKAQKERNARILGAEQQFNDQLARGMTQVLMGHQTFAAMITSFGNQIASGMMENALKSILADDFTKEHDAAAAARKMYLAGTQLPFPANIVMAPVLGAAAFASVMAFEDGGIVPGFGRGDVVPAMLTPGEGVVPKGVMEGLSSMARSGNMGGGNHYHVRAHFAPNVQAIDGAGLDKILTKHQALFQKHMTNTLRKMNK